MYDAIGLRANGVQATFKVTDTTHHHVNISFRPQGALSQANTSLE